MAVREPIILPQTDALTAASRWWLGIVGNAFRLKRNYSTPGPVSTAMGDCLQAGNAIGFRASREHELKFLVKSLVFDTFFVFSK